MNNMKLILFYLILSISILFVGINETGYAEEQQDECIFTSYLEKSWIQFQERPWVTGSVINCDEGIENHKRDSVYIRILDINGDVVDDGWKPEARANPVETPNKYIFNDQVYRGGSQGNADVTNEKVIYIRDNQYFLYLPQIHSIDFEHRGVYQIELTYGVHTNTIWFAVLDPDKRWDEN